MVALEKMFLSEVDFDYKSTGSLKSNLSIVIGISTVKRKKAVYIYQALAALFRGFDKDYHNDTGVIILVGQGDMDYHQEECRKLL